MVNEIKDLRSDLDAGSSDTTGTSTEPVAVNETTLQPAPGEANSSDATGTSTESVSGSEITPQPTLGEAARLLVGTLIRASPQIMDTPPQTTEAVEETRE